MVEYESCNIKFKSFLFNFYACWKSWLRWERMIINSIDFEYSLEKYTFNTLIMRYKISANIMEKLLINSYAMQASEQKEKLTKKFSDWNGLLDQVDDVCLIGIRV